MRSGLFRKRSLKSYVNIVLLASLALTSLVVVARQLGMLEGMELYAYDSFIRLKPAEPMDARILVVGISEDDIQSRREYPIEDGTIADLLEKLKADSPRVIGLDILRDVPQGPDEGRNRMINILKSSSNIVAGCLLSSERELGYAPAPGVSLDRVGFADFPQDFDGKVRRSILVSEPYTPPVLVDEPHPCNNARPENKVYEETDKYEVYSLSLQLSRLYLQQEGLSLERPPSGLVTFDNTTFPPLFEQSGGYVSSGATDYQMMLNYRADEDAVNQVSLTEVMDDEVPPSQIRDKIVLIGYTSQVTNDFFLTPYVGFSDGFREMAGVTAHAQATSQIISAVLDDRPTIQDWPELIEIIWIFGCSLAGGSIAFVNRRLLIGIAGCAGLVAAYWAICLFFFAQGLWLPLVPSIMSFVLTAMGVAVLDRANQDGYAQAIYEQMRAQLSGASTSPQAERRNYLENLVYRAKLSRLSRQGSTMLQRDADNPDNAQFDSPEIQSLYEQIKARAIAHEKDAKAEQQRQKALAQERKVKQLVDRSKLIRERQ